MLRVCHVTCICGKKWFHCSFVPFTNHPEYHLIQMINLFFWYTGVVFFSPLGVNFTILRIMETYLVNQKPSPCGSDQPSLRGSEKFMSELMSAWIHISCSACSGMTGSKQIKNENINRRSSPLSLCILRMFRKETTTKNSSIDPLAWLSVWIFEALQLC